MRNIGPHDAVLDFPDRIPFSLPAAELDDMDLGDLVNATSAMNSSITSIVDWFGIATTRHPAAATQGLRDTAP